MRQIGYVRPSFYLFFVDKTIYMPEWLYFLISSFIIVGTVNAVNITDGIDGLAFRSRPQMTGQVVQRCRQSQQILGFLTGRHFRIFADDAGCIALITELMDPRRLFQGAAVIVSDDIRYDESFTGPGRA